MSNQRNGTIQGNYVRDNINKEKKNISDAKMCRYFKMSLLLLKMENQYL